VFKLLNPQSQGCPWLSLHQSSLQCSSLPSCSYLPSVFSTSWLDITSLVYRPATATLFQFGDIGWFNSTESLGQVPIEILNFKPYRSETSIRTWIRYFSILPLWCACPSNPSITWIYKNFWTEDWVKEMMKKKATGFGFSRCCNESYISPSVNTIQQLKLGN